MMWQPAAQLVTKANISFYKYTFNVNNNYIKVLFLSFFLSSTVLFSQCQLATVRIVLNLC
jgi:hypothetical protein